MSLLLKQNRNRTKSITDVVSTVRGSLRAPEAVGAGVMDTGNRPVLWVSFWRVGAGALQVLGAPGADCFSVSGTFTWSC